MSAQEDVNKIYNINVRPTNYITCSIPNSNKTKRFLVDTGAEVSIIKNSHDLYYLNNLEDKTISMTGITSEKISTLGILHSKVNINNFSFAVDFNLVSEDFPIITDGILGQDFLEEYKCILDFSSQTLTLNFWTQTTTNLHLYSNINIISIPPRCEVYRNVLISNLSEDSVIFNNEIKPGVFIASSIVNKDNPIIKILNTNDFTVNIDNPKFDFQPLSLFHIKSQTEFDKTQEEEKEKIKSESNSNRAFEVWNQISKINDHIPKNILEHLKNLILEFHDVFGLKDEKLTTNNFYKQKLKLTDETPVYIKNHRLPHSQKDEIKKQIDRMLKDNIIEPSISPYNSPIFLVPKKSLTGNPTEKRWRLVVDFRQLNKKLVRDVYPIPRIDDAIDELGNNRYFSVLDLLQGFFQISLQDDSKDLTSFSTDSASYRFNRLPFGISVAPNSFCRMMSLAFAGLPPHTALLYMDDLIVIGSTVKKHLQNLRLIFEKARSKNLKLNPEKCIFFRPEVVYLGHKCTDHGVTVDESKVEAVKNYPVPKNGLETKRFVAFANYFRRFIKNFSLITKCLNKLTRKNAIFVWTDECQTAFEIIKKSLMSYPILQYPDFNKEMVIITDASKEGIGATLAQEHEGILKPISYFSKPFTTGESNKATIEQELLGIYFSILHFKPYIYGKRFKVLTDHKPLVYLFSLKDPSSRLTRIRVDLEEYDFYLEHLPGKQNFIADALSRIHSKDLIQINTENVKIAAITRSMTRNTQINNNENSKTKEKITKPQFIYLNNELISSFKYAKLHTTLEDNFYKVTLTYKKNKILLHKFPREEKEKTIDTYQLVKTLYETMIKLRINDVIIYINSAIFKYIELKVLKACAVELLKDKCIIVMRAPEFLDDNNKINEILEKFHNDPLNGGHCGMKRTLNKIKNHYKFNKMASKVKKYINKCELCKKNKIFKHIREPMVITETPKMAFDVVQIDTCGPLPITSSGNRYIVTSQCELTKFVILSPIPDKSAISVANAIFNDVILKYNVMRTIKTDQGSEYLNEVIKELCKLLKIEHRTSTAFRHQTLGNIERNHRELNTFLRNYSDKDWDKWSNIYSWCYNTTPSIYHNYTPYELVFGHSHNLPENFLSENVTPLYNHEDYAKLIKYQLQTISRRVKSLIEAEKIKRKLEYDRKTNPINLKIGDKIYLTNEARTKLDSFYKGPFEVIKILDNNNVEISYGSSSKIVHKNRLIV